MRGHALDTEPGCLLGRRIIAGLIDWAAMAVLAAIACELGLLGARGWMAADAVLEPLRKLVTLLVFLGYLAVLQSVGRQPATWGQRLCGLAIVGPGGGRLRPGEALARALALLCAALPLGAGLLLALTPARRPFQDLLCASRVVRAAARSPAPLTRAAAGPT